MGSLSTLLPPLMLQLPNMYISDNTQLVLGAAACLGVVLGVIARTYLSNSDGGLPLPPCPPTWRLWGHSLPPPPDKYVSHLTDCHFNANGVLQGHFSL